MCLKGLKKPLYHGTSCKNIDKIKLDGLKSTCSPVHVETYNDKKDRFAVCGVFLTEDIEGALSYAYDASKDCCPELLDVCSADEENMCVVRINKVPEGTQIGSDGYNNFMANGDIPSDCIDVLRPRDLRNILGVSSLMDAI